MRLNPAAFRPLREHSARIDCDFSSFKQFTRGFVRPEISAQAEQMLGAPAIGNFGMGEGGTPCRSAG